MEALRDLEELAQKWKFLRLKCENFRFELTSILIPYMIGFEPGLRELWAFLRILTIDPQNLPLHTRLKVDIFSNRSFQQRCMQQQYLYWAPMGRVNRKVGSKWHTFAGKISCFSAPQNPSFSEPPSKLNYTPAWRRLQIRKLPPPLPLEDLLYSKM